LGISTRARPAARDSKEDSGPFVQREDDTEEAIRHRLRIYHEQPETLKDYYAQQGISVAVDAAVTIPVVTRTVLELTT